MCLSHKTLRGDKPYSSESRVGFRELLKEAGLSALPAFPPSLLQIINENFMRVLMQARLHNRNFKLLLLNFYIPLKDLKIP